MYGKYGIGKRNVDRRRQDEFCDGKELCTANTWFQKKKQNKTTYSMSGNEIEIDFVLAGKNSKVLKRRESNPLRVVTLPSGNKHRQKKDFRRLKEFINTDAPST